MGKTQGVLYGKSKGNQINSNYHIKYRKLPSKRRKTMKREIVRLRTTKHKSKSVRFAIYKRNSLSSKCNSVHYNLDKGESI